MNSSVDCVWQHVMQSAGRNSPTTITTTTPTPNPIVNSNFNAKLNDGGLCVCVGVCVFVCVCVLWLALGCGVPVKCFTLQVGNCPGTEHQAPSTECQAINSNLAKPRRYPHQDRQMAIPTRILNAQTRTRSWECYGLVGTSVSKQCTH